MGKDLFIYSEDSICCCYRQNTRLLNLFIEFVYFILIYFSSNEKQASFVHVNLPRTFSWNQLVLSNKAKVSCSSKQWELFIGLKLMTDL